jgi:AmmeMemoRadiSam system protein B
MSENIRFPAVSGQFYPGKAEDLRKTLTGFFAAAAVPQPAVAVMCPHAGYIYSGALAAATFAQVKIPKRVILLGPTHHGLTAPAAVSLATWRTPLADTPVDAGFAESLLAQSPLIVHDETGHQREHCLEVQLPFLQYLRGDVKIVPLLVSAMPFQLCQEIAKALAAAIREAAGETLIVASTDMSHYLPRRQAAHLDGLALARVLALDPLGLHQTCVDNRISMCGFVAVTITMLTILELGPATARLVGYTDSGVASGNEERVVGYAGVVSRAKKTSASPSLAV